MKSAESASRPKIMIWVSKVIQNSPANSGPQAAMTSPAIPMARAGLTSMLLAEDSGRPEQEQDRHRAEQHEVGEFRQQPAAIGIEQADDDAAEDRALEA